MVKHERKFTTVVGMIGFILIGIIVVYLIKILYQSGYSPQNNPVNTESKTKTFISKNLNFQVEVPEDFTVDEESGTVKISNSRGNIYIDMNGTNFKTINDYLDDLNKRNNSIIENEQDLKINDLPAIKGIINKKSYYYFIYSTQWRIFTIFTDIESLHTDLDHIAQSFRYVE